MSTIFTAVKTFIADENGVTAIEYGLIAALIGIVMAGTAKLAGVEVAAMFSKVSTALTEANKP
jgi:pilus assembly protein Flp/PilA